MTEIGDFVARTQEVRWQVHLDWYRRGITKVLPTIPVLSVLDPVVEFPEKHLRDWYREMAKAAERTMEALEKAERGHIVSSRMADPIIIEDF